MFSEYDKYLFHEGKHCYCYEFMGAHMKIEDKKKGVRFTTWAPNGEAVYAVGDFSNWEIEEKNKLIKVTESGMWTSFIRGINKDEKYKFAIKTRDERILLKSDPFARKSELRPDTASIITSKSKFKWTDKNWWRRCNTDHYKKPMNIYEMHLGSWKTREGKFYSYEDLANELPKYLLEMGYTHVEFMPLTEHPLDKSWGYQGTGFYSPTSRYGDSDGLKHLINELHKLNIGVILDWVPGHFCRDDHGLAYFDGEAVYEYAEGWKAENKGWGTLNFDLGRPEVKSFLYGSAFYWVKEFHIDGFRVDAVSNMLYLSYGRNEGEWIRNEDGTDINEYAVEFIQELNILLNEKFPNILLIAEESTTWEKVSYPVKDGGLGFNYKWNMGWMNDTLEYVEIDPIYRKYDHNKMNFSMMYNYNEHFILPLSHDEVVHGKKSILDKMWGDYWTKFAGFRTYMTYMMGHPGKKLLFMGAEFGQFIEWREYENLNWELINEFEMHEKTHKFFKDLNRFYKKNRALWEKDYENDGFKWIDADNKEKSIYSFIRKGGRKTDTLIFICNFTPVYYEKFKIGVPFKGVYSQLFNSDLEIYGGTNKVLEEKIKAKKEEVNDMEYSIEIAVPPMGSIVLKIN
ncbi:1,4-alpha-glucan branching protein GlgB [uncultured Clostridium sp.]|uniref:1,4-alpha-glucan branching protein GlgB n=1 Tax=uncultured Clostridium sp. TaxID=59620 RepID=UPI0026088EC8|nr:1,4-alpha-glucan branching protein GlgB [uncultured Clostridium sp.]